MNCTPFVRPVSYTHLDVYKRQLLYRVSYYGARINVEMFHAISDGNGGMVFLKTLVPVSYTHLQQ